MGRTPDGRIRLLYISSIDIRWLHLEWICERLDRERFDVSFLLLSFKPPPALELFLAARGIPFETVPCRLTPLSILRAVRAVYRRCRHQRVDVVHTHIYFASLVGLVGAFLARTPVRINTRHHSVPNHGSAGIWLDRLTNRLATRIVATSEALRRVLIEREGAAPEKVSLIHLGIDLDCFYKQPPEVVATVAASHNPARSRPVIGVIARHIELKGIQYIIPAFHRLLATYPDAYLVLAYAFGPYHATIEEQLAALPPDRFVQFEFEPNVFALYQMFDVFVHVPIGEELESFGLVYLEALAAGVPSVFTLSGIAPEFLVHGENAWIVDHKNSGQIHDGLLRLLSDPALCKSLVQRGRQSVDPVFSLPTMINALEGLYTAELASFRRRVF